MTDTAAAAAAARAAAMAEISHDLLVVLKQHDPAGTILSTPIPSSDGPPSKRARLAAAKTPPTLARRLEEGAYALLNPILADVAAVCKVVMETNAVPAAQVAHFEEFAGEVVRSERGRRAKLFEFAEEWRGVEEEGGAGKVALTVMAHHGPLFSSLQTPVEVPLEKAEGETTPGAVHVLTPLNDAALPPLITTAKPAPLKRPLSPPPRIPTLLDSFPPVRPISLPAPKPHTTTGLTWGGLTLPGGIPPPSSTTRPEPTGEWLSYRNHPLKNDTLHRPRRHEPTRLGIGLPADFVRAYSSFAPTRDDGGAAKVPARVRERVWWERGGQEIFARVLSDTSTFWGAHTPPPVQEDIMDVESTPAPATPTPAADESESESFRLAVETWEPDTSTPPLDPPPPTTAEETLTQISDLLLSLRSHQYHRLSAQTTPAEPTEEETALYKTLHTRLSALIAELPPHATSTTDGTPLAPLAVSTRLPIYGGRVYSGTLPSSPKAASAQLSLAALNAAVGMSPTTPFSAAPVARMNVPVPPPPRLAGAPNVQYHAHQMPSPSPQYTNGGGGGGATTPHHYPSPYAPAPRVVHTPSHPTTPSNGGMQFHGHSMPGRRMNVPPPQGLAAVGVGVYAGGGQGGYGGGGGYSREELRMGVQHTQASMENGVVPGGRYAGRSRR